MLFHEGDPRRPRLAAVAIILLAVLAPGCRTGVPRLGPETRLESVEGYASLKFKGAEAEGRSKVSFSIALPDRARVDVFDALGRAVITLIARGRESYFVTVRERAYWRGGPGEGFAKFLGFDLSPAELAGILAGRWAGEPGSAPPAPEAAEAWRLTRDAQGRVVSASRGDVTFSVTAFFPGTTLPHVVTFAGGESSGTLRVFEARFNVSPPESAFGTGFLKDFTSKSWPEMEELLRHEDRVVR